MKKWMPLTVSLLAAAALAASWFFLVSLINHLDVQPGHRHLVFDNEKVVLLKYLLWGCALLAGTLVAAAHCMFLRLSKPDKEYSLKRLLFLIPGIPIAVVSLMLVRHGIASQEGWYSYSAVQAAYLVLFSTPVGLYFIGIGLFPLPRRTPSISTMAVGSLVLALCGFITYTVSAYLGLVLGIVALVRIRRSKGKLQGKGYAVAGTIISAVLIASLLGSYPFISRARFQALKTQGGENLKQISLAIFLYRNENDDKWPSSLLDVCMYCENLDQLVEPLDEHPQLLHPAEEYWQLPRDIECSFVFVGELPGEVPPELIVAYTRKGIYSDGRHVLFADGGVKWVFEDSLHTPGGAQGMSLKECYHCIIDLLGNELTKNDNARLKEFYELNAYPRDE